MNWTTGELVKVGTGWQPDYRVYDPGKVGILGCSGVFEPENRQPHGALRPGKTYQDRMVKENRPRVKEWQKRLDKLRKHGTL